MSPNAETFEIRTARTGMSETEIRKFVGDFTEALVRTTLTRTLQVDVEVRTFGNRFDNIAESLEWGEMDLLARAGIEPEWVRGGSLAHRILMHPDFVTNQSLWPFVRDYLTISMVSEKFRKVLFPNLVRARRPSVSTEVLLDEAKILNFYLNLVQQSGLTGDRITAYAGDLRTHGQGQNDSGRMGAVGAAIAVLDAVNEIHSGAITSTYGTMPHPTLRTPADIAKEMIKPGYTVPRAVLLSTHRAIIFSADPDIAIVSRIGGHNPYGNAQEAYDEWAVQKKRQAEERQALIHQAALGEVKTALDVSNVHERLALGSRENRQEAHAIRFLMMAVLTPDIVDPTRKGRRSMYSRDAARFQHVFNLYFLWGYDGARERHPEHWNHFKTELKRWCGL